MEDRKRAKLKIPSTREVFKMMINRKEWHKKTPFEKWSFLYGVDRSAFIPLGFTAFEDDQTLRWYSHVTTAYMVGYFLLAAYTAFYYITHGEFVKCLPCTCMFGLLASVCIFLNFYED